MSEPEILSLNPQAGLGDVQPERSQLSHLVRHFLERFFNHETASPDGDAKARLILIAFTTGLPGFVVALYLWPDYHSFIPYMRNHHVVWVPGPPPYWVQVNQHFFFALYSFIVMGIVTVFEWDMFFPDLLDLWVLKTLPIAEIHTFLARVAAIAIFIAGFLFNANILAILVLPSAVDPPIFFRFLIAHVLAVLASGLFAATFILAVQGVLLSILGERFFRKISLAMQSLSITILLMLLLLFPVLSGVVPFVLQSDTRYAFFFPPFWFLGIYQCLLEGSSSGLPIYVQLAKNGCIALMLLAGLAVIAYPFAYLRRVRQLVEGPGAQSTQNRLGLPIARLIHGTLVRVPMCRAVFHFISQTLLRVQRYRIYLVLYGGVGVSVVASSILRLSVMHQQVRMEISSDGIRASTGILAFWLISGLRMAFVSNGNEQGSWIFRHVHGRPPHFDEAMEQLRAARVWVLLWALIVTCGTCLASRVFAPAELLTWPAMASQLLVATGMCLLLTDILFLNVKIVAFTGERTSEQPNLATSVLKYFAFVPAVAWIPLISEPWIEISTRHFIIAAAAIAVTHLALRSRHRVIVREHCNTPGLEEDEKDFILKLGLHY